MTGLPQNVVGLKAKRYQNAAELDLCKTEQTLTLAWRNTSRVRLKKSKKLTDEELLAEVFKEMARPRVARSAQRKLENYGKRRNTDAVQTN